MKSHMNREPFAISGFYGSFEGDLKRMDISGLQPWPHKPPRSHGSCKVKGTNITDHLFGLGSSIMYICLLCLYCSIAIIILHLFTLNVRWCAPFLCSLQPIDLLI